LAAPAGAALEEADAAGLAVLAARDLGAVRRPEKK
jgi:hypothetical protein